MFAFECEERMDPQQKELVQIVIKHEGILMQVTSLVLERVRELEKSIESIVEIT